jgi:hypothetical protein
MFNIGDKVYFISKVDEKPIYGYVVKIEIDPGFEQDVKEVSVYYTVRVFRDFYTDGCADFMRMGNELHHAEG